jgi:hypothetical protein
MSYDLKYIIFSFEGAWSSDSDVDRYVIIIYLLEYVCIA